MQRPYSVHAVMSSLGCMKEPFFCLLNSSRCHLRPHSAILRHRHFSTVIIILEIPILYTLTRRRKKPERWELKSGFSRACESASGGDLGIGSLVQDFKWVPWAVESSPSFCLMPSVSPDCEHPTQASPSPGLLFHCSGAKELLTLMSVRVAHCYYAIAFLLSQKGFQYL